MKNKLESFTISLIFVSAFFPQNLLGNDKMTLGEFVDGKNYIKESTKNKFMEKIKEKYNENTFETVNQINKYKKKN